MRNLQFQVAKLRRLIQIAGTTLSFQRDNLNSLKEPDGTSTVVCTAKGVWHTTNEYITITSGDAASVQSKNNPRFLVQFKDAEKISQGDYTMLNGKKYKVSGITNVGDICLASDISLEETV